MPSLVPIERSETTPEMWEKLKSFIIRRHEKRKQEEEQDAEQERHRREMELKRKRDAMTLEDIKDQLSKLETHLEELRANKHEAFLKLKKVLNEDENRKKQREKEAEVANQQNMNGHPYHPYYLSTPSMMQAQMGQPCLYSPIRALNAPMTPMMGNLVDNNSSNAHSSNHTNLVPVSSYSSSPSMNNSALKRVPLKRSHERSPSPPARVPYTGILPVYRTTMPYTSLPRTSQAGSYQLYYHQGSPELKYDAKGNAYHIFPNGAAFHAPESQAMDPYGYEASKYYQTIRGSLVPHPSASTLIPIHPAPTKPGGITGGFPVQRANPASSTHGRDGREPGFVPYPMYF